MNSITLNVKGMGCGGCEIAVQNSVSKLSGVAKVKADHKTGKVVVEYSGGSPSEIDLKEAVAKAGYELAGTI